MQVATGTSGYAYKEWRGAFYPEELKDKDFLTHYGTRLRTVEINNTFYRMPKREVVAKWAASVPDGFRFVLKASQRITHKKKLADCEDELSYFTGSAAELGDKKAPLLFQLPPWLRRDDALLRDFLAMIPDGFRAAMEFRHHSWFDDAVYETLRTGNGTLVISQSDKAPEPPVEHTADDAYFRLRLPTYTEADLTQWAETIRGGAWKSAYVYFKHEADAGGPRMAEAFQQRFAET